MTTYVRRDWIPQNEYTTPIRETPVYCNSGIIKAVTKEKMNKKPPCAMCLSEILKKHKNYIKSFLNLAQ